MGVTEFIAVRRSRTGRLTGDRSGLKGNVRKLLFEQRFRLPELD